MWSPPGKVKAIRRIEEYKLQALMQLKCYKIFISCYKFRAKPYPPVFVSLPPEISWNQLSA